MATRKFNLDWLASRPKWQVMVIGLGVTFLLGLIDYMTGDFSLTLLYILPVFIGAWYVSKLAGVGFASLSVLVIYSTHQLPPVVLFSKETVKSWNTLMELGFLVVMNQMFCLLKEELEKEKAMARTDHLTGALNRRSFVELAQYEIMQSRRHRRALTIAYVDLDNFKAVNDRLGHHIGDMLLSTVVAVLQETSRMTDIVARLGGDEFAILFPATDAPAASETIARVQQKLLDAMSGNDWPVSFSIGAITYPLPPVSVEVMLKEADARMYAVKHNGKNSFSHIVVEETGQVVG